MSDNAIIVNVACGVKPTAGPAAHQEASIWGANGRALADQNKKDAQAFAQAIRQAMLEISFDVSIWGSWGDVRATAVAKEMNARGIPSPGGGKWHPTSVRRLVSRLGPSFRQEVREASMEAKWVFESKRAAEGNPYWKGVMPAKHASDTKLDKSGT